MGCHRSGLTRGRAAPGVATSSPNMERAAGLALATRPSASTASTGRSREPRMSGTEKGAGMGDQGSLGALFGWWKPFTATKKASEARKTPGQEGAVADALAGKDGAQPKAAGVPSLRQRPGRPLSRRRGPFEMRQCGRQRQAAARPSARMSASASVSPTLANVSSPPRAKRWFTSSSTPR